MAAPSIHIIHDDPDLLVVSKPAGMLVHREVGSRTFEHVLMNTVRDQVGAWVYPVHRLDRNTSGLVAFARSSEGAHALQKALANKGVIKGYLALVRGHAPDEFESDRPLTNNAGEPRPARSTFCTLARFDRCSLLAVRIYTGRHHQIRRHLNHLAHHVLGDTTHGKGRINQFFRDEYGLPRMFLHAGRLAFNHPSSGDWLEVCDPLAADLVLVLRRLGWDGDPDVTVPGPCCR